MKQNSQGMGVGVVGGSLVERVGLMQPLFSVPNLQPSYSFAKRKDTTPIHPTTPSFAGCQRKSGGNKERWSRNPWRKSMDLMQECWAVAAHFRAHGRVIRTHTAYYAAHGTPHRARIRNLHHRSHQPALARCMPLYS